MGNCLSEKKLTKGDSLKNQQDTDADKEEDRGPPGDVLYAAVDYSRKRSARAPSSPDSSPSECDYSVIMPPKPPAPPPDTTSEAEEGADDYVLMQ